MSKSKLTRHWLLTNIERAQREQRAQGKSETLWNIVHDKGNPLLSSAASQKYTAYFNQIHAHAVGENSDAIPEANDVSLHVQITQDGQATWIASSDEDWKHWHQMHVGTTYSEPAVVSDDVEFIPRGPEDAARVAHVEPAPRLVLEPPGAGLMQLLDYLPAKGRLRKDIEQVVADTREMHFECLSSGDERGAELALWRGRWEVVSAILPSWAMGVVSWAARRFAAKFLGLS